MSTIPQIQGVATPESTIGKTREAVVQRLRRTGEAIKGRFKEGVEEFRFRLTLSDIAGELAKSDVAPVMETRKLIGFLVGGTTGRTLPLWEGLNGFSLDRRGEPAVSRGEPEHELRVQGTQVRWQRRSADGVTILESNDGLELGHERFWVKLIPEDRQRVKEHT
jgi:hypothetical protein